MEIRDWTLTRRYLDELKANDWKWELHVKKAIMNVQTKKNRKWSQRRLAKCLDQSPSLISDDLELAKALEKHPQLRDCKNKRDARQRLKLLKIKELSPSTVGIGREQLFRVERELRDFLARNWDHTSLNADWEFVGSEYPTSVGNIDLLARRKTERKWLVIELKVSKTSDDVIGQVLRYMGWAKLNLARAEGEKVEGLIIAPGIDEHTFCALVDLKGLNVKLYRLSVEAAVVFVRAWINGSDVKVLNVAGPRASKDPKIYRTTRRLLTLLLQTMSLGTRKSQDPLG